MKRTRFPWIAGLAAVVATLGSAGCDDEPGGTFDGGTGGGRDAAGADASGGGGRDAGEVRLDGGLGGADAAGGADGGVVDGGGSDGGLGDGGVGLWPVGLDVRTQRGFVVKAFARASGGVVMLVEPPQHLHREHGRPRREVHWISAAGALEQTTAPNPGVQLLDLAVHPSGDMTVLMATDAGYRLRRTTSDGTGLAFLDVTDDRIDADPPAFAPNVPSAPITSSTRDGGRIAPAGEDIVLAFRTGRESVLVHRYRFVGGGGFARTQRVLAFPAASIPGIGLRGGSYDTFGQVDSQYFVHVAVDGAGMTYVGVRHPRISPSRYVRTMREVFGETIPSDDDFLDSYVARISPDGRRLGTSVIRTDKADEIYALRATARAAYALGRNELWNEQGTGFDGLLARIDGETGAVTVREVDVDRSDIAFDVAEAPGGGLVVVGASGYTQNPNGASISEESRAFARWLRADGTAVDLAVPQGPRHNEARFVAIPAPGRLLVGGMHDGPGTHSADGDDRLLRASGFLAEVPWPTP